jgi:hypothetical protein
MEIVNQSSLKKEELEEVVFILKKHYNPPGHVKGVLMINCLVTFRSDGRAIIRDS